MIEQLFELIMAPISWVVTEAIVFAVTAPLQYVYIAMGVAAILTVALIYSMIPKKTKVASPVVQVIEPTEEEREAMEALRGVTA